MIQTHLIRYSFIIFQNNGVMWSINRSGYRRKQLTFQLMNMVRKWSELSNTLLCLLPNELYILIHIFMSYDAFQKWLFHNFCILRFRYDMVKAQSIPLAFQFFNDSSFLTSILMFTFYPVIFLAKYWAWRKQIRHLAKCRHSSSLSHLIIVCYSYSCRRFIKKHKRS